MKALTPFCALALLLSNVFTSSLHAKQTIQDQQKRLIQIFSLLHDERLLTSPGEGTAGWLLGMDLSILPEVDTTVGVKKENVDFTPAIPRPFVRYTFSQPWFIQGSAHPEIDVNGARTQGLSLKGGFGKDVSWGKWTFWGSYTTGRIVAPITAPELPSEDELEFNIRGAGVTYGYSIQDWTPYVSLEYRDFNGSLHVPEDQTTLLASYQGMVTGIGLAWKINEHWNTAAEIAHTPEIVTNPRLSLSYQF